MHMLRRLRPIAIAAFVIFSGSAFAPSADPCTDQSCVYIPLVTTAESQVEVLPVRFTFIDTSKNLHIVGEVQNDTQENQENVNISVNVYNAQNGLVGSNAAKTLLQVLPAGEKTCFEITMPEPAGWSFYRFDPVASSATSASSLPLTVLNDAGKY